MSESSNKPTIILDPHAPVTPPKAPTPVELTGFPEPDPTPPATSPAPVFNPRAFVSVQVDTGKGPLAPVTIMRSGTTTSSFDRDMAEAQESARLRQKASDEERRQGINMRSAKSLTEAELKQQQADTIAAAISADKGINYERRIGSSMESGVVIIEIPSRDGRKTRFCQADVFVANTDVGPVPTLVLICPNCVENLKKPQMWAQIRIRADNRKWDLDTKFAGQTWVDPDTNESYVLAGTVNMESAARCPNEFCGFRFRITSDNPEYPMTSKLVRA